MSFIYAATCSDLPNYSIINVVKNNPALNNASEIKEKYTKYGNVTIHYQAEFFGSKYGYSNGIGMDSMTKDILSVADDGGLFNKSYLLAHKTDIDEGIFKLPIEDALKFLVKDFSYSKIEYYKNDSESKDQIQFYIDKQKRQAQEQEIVNIESKKFANEISKAEEIWKKFTAETNKEVQISYIAHKSTYGFLGSLLGNRKLGIAAFNEGFLPRKWEVAKTLVPNLHISCTQCNLDATVNIEYEKELGKYQLRFNRVHIKCKHCGYANIFSYNKSQTFSYYLPTDTETFRDLFEQRFRGYFFDLIR